MLVLSAGDASFEYNALQHLAAMRCKTTLTLALGATVALFFCAATGIPALKVPEAKRKGRSKKNDGKRDVVVLNRGKKIDGNENIAVLHRNKNKTVAGKLTPAARVIHGEPVVHKADWEFVVDLHKSPNFVSKSRFCTGTLIRKNIVLTAAHCVLNDGEMGEGTFATMGRINLLDGHKDNREAESLRAVAAIAHPAYSGLGSRADVALLLLEGTSTKSRIKLANRSPAPGTNTTIVGYGLKAVGTLEATHRVIEVLPDRMQKTKLKIEQRSFCDAPGSMRTATGMLCTSGLHRGSSACRGDSGGGLFLDSPNAAIPKTQVGIVSYGDAMCMSEDAGVFTDVASVRGWIDETIERLVALHYGAEPVEAPAVGRTARKVRGAAKTYADGRALKLFRVTKGMAGARVEVSACVRRVTGGRTAPRLFLARGVGRNVQEATVVGGRNACRAGHIGLWLAYDVSANAGKGKCSIPKEDVIGLAHTGKKGGKLEFEFSIRTSKRL